MATETAAKHHRALEELAALFPPDRLITNNAELFVYECDGMTLERGKASAVVLVETTEEVVSLVEWCRRHQVPFVPRGARRKLGGAESGKGAGGACPYSRKKPLKIGQPPWGTGAVWWWLSRCG